jgi:SAM-dependent methyltransferase
LAESVKEAQDPNSRSHPEIAAGGYASNNGTVEFYQRVAAVVPEDGRVLDLGAGRGAVFEGNHSPWQQSLLRLGRKYSARIGADIDPAVRDNPELDEAVVIEPGKPLPFADQSFDLVLCDWVIEHIEDPELFVSEIKRILRVGGWFCARTPNRWSYFSVGARLLSSSAGNRVLRILQSQRAERDVFPKHYRMNTLASIERHFPATDWINATYTHNPDPGYAGGSAALYRLIDFYQRLAPRALGTVILVFAQRIA